MCPKEERDYIDLGIIHKIRNTKVKENRIDTKKKKENEKEKDKRREE